MLQVVGGGSRGRKFLTTAFAATALFASALPAHATRVPFPLTPIPSELVKSANDGFGKCTCFSYPIGSAMKDDDALLLSQDDHIVVMYRGQQVKLPKVRYSKEGKFHVNEYQGSGLAITLRSRETKFRPACERHLDPPTHGSCFVGKIYVTGVNAAVKPQAVTEMCTC